MTYTGRLEMVGLKKIPQTTARILATYWLPLFAYRSPRMALVTKSLVATSEVRENGLVAGNTTVLFSSIVLSIPRILLQEMLDVLVVTVELCLDLWASPLLRYRTVRDLRERVP